jgi:hypothetical protein
MMRSITRLTPLMFGLFLLGCSGSLDSRAEVSGTVTYKGKPLPGGIITFVSEKGFQYSANIDENGHYKIEVGMGLNKISVDNRLLKKDLKAKGPRLKPQEGSAPQTELAGTYVPIKESYASAQTSGLDCTVTSGTQVNDVPLQ